MRYVIVWFALLCPVLIGNATSCNDKPCIAVVDAGSSGSRVHIYAYDLDGQTPTNIKEVYAKKIQPGFATLNLNQETIHAYLTKLFAGAPYENIPVYFYSTAGMRLLPYHKQQEYYTILNEWFSSQSQWQLREAKTITGKEEGVFGWIAVNYELGNFTSAEKPMVGVMDTGGASVQITFPVTDTQAVKNDDKVELDINGRHVQLFVHSFLGLGQNELGHQFLDNPDCFSNGYPLPNATTAHGNLANCGRDISTLINKVHHVDQTIKPIIESNPINTWYGIGGIGYIAQAEPLDFPSNTFSLKQLADQANAKLCQQDWTVLNNQNPGNEYTYISCLNASYVYSLLQDGYGIDQDQTIHYFPREQNNDDWTLGVVLHH